MSPFAADPDGFARAMEAVALELLGPPAEKRRNGLEWRYGTNGSLSIRIDLGTFTNHETGENGGTLAFVMAQCRTDKAGALAWMRERGHLRQDTPHKPAGKRQVAAYRYVDAVGELLFEVVRFEPKAFRQRRPDGNGGWIWKMAGVQLVPFHLPEVLSAIAVGEPVFIAEGEKGVLALEARGIPATCSPGGAGKWRDEYAVWLNGANAIILPDNDEAGRRHAAMVAASLRGKAHRVRVLALPGLPEKGDVADWLDAGGTAAALEALVEEQAREPEVEAEVESASGPKFSLAALEYLAAEGWAKREFPEPIRLLGDLVTSTSRMFLVGATGLGKTMLGIAIAAGMATGTGFLNWPCDRPARVLYIDGEMPGELVKTRVRDAMRRLGREDLMANMFVYCFDTAEDFAKLVPGLGVMAPLNTEAGQNFIYALIGGLGGIDVVIFDNVMSLVTGDHKDEIPWTDTLPLVSGLTRQQVGQVWLDHAGHNTARQYGTSTKAWRFDAVGIMTELPEDQRVERETAFRLSFDAPGKARRRTPDNWEQFAPRTIRLVGDQWASDARVSSGSGSGVGAVPWPTIAAMFDTLDAAWREGKPWSPNPQSRRFGRYFPEFASKEWNVKTSAVEQLLADWLMGGYLALEEFTTRSKSKGLRVVRRPSP